MKKILLAFTVLIAMLFGGDYEDGVKAYKNKDYKKTAELFQKAADKGNKWAQKDLALLYDNGQGVKQDYKKAAEYYQKASDQGVAQAQYNLGIFYKDGMGVEKDYKKAVELFQKAADQGHIYGQNNLAFMG